MKQSSHLKFLVSLTVLLALLTTALVSPGWALPLLEPKAENVRHIPLQLNTGNSRAFHISPLKGVTISAEKNALDKNRTFTMTKENEATFEQLSQIAEGQYGHALLAAWDLDAGLEDDALLPGVYQVELDLNALGIPEELFSDLAVWRINDQGTWFQYTSQLDGSVLRFESNQNSILAITASVALRVAAGGAVIFFGYLFEQGRYRWPTDATMEIKIPGETADGAEPSSEKHIFNLHFPLNAEANALKNRLNEMHEKKTEALINPTRIKLRNAGKNYQDDEIVKAAASKEAMLALEQDRQFSDLKKRFTDTLSSDSGKSDSINSASSCLINAYSYLKNQAKVKAPTYVVNAFLSDTFKQNEEADGTVVTKYLNGEALMVLDYTALTAGQRGVDQFRVTCTHEMTHVFQRNYTSSTYSNVKFDEATAQLIETACASYYYDQGIAASVPNTDENAKRYEMYACPFPETSIWWANVIDGVGSFNKNNDPSDFGYPLSHFVQYVWERNTGAVAKMNFGALFDAYGALDSDNRDLTRILLAAFNIDLNQLNTLYEAFAMAHQAKLLERQKTAFNLGFGAYNYASVKDQEFSATIRHLFPKVCPTCEVWNDEDGQMALLLVRNEHFNKRMPDIKLIPIGDMKTSVYDNGLYYAPASVSDFEKSAYLMELDLGRGEAVNQQTAYRGVVLKSLPKVEADIKQGKLTFQMPEKSKAATEGHVKGFLITIRCSDGKVTERIVSLAKAGKKASYKLKRLCYPESLKEGADSLTFEISVREFVKNGDTLLLGPGSEGTRMEQDMKEMLDLMGAATGAIQVSLGWNTPDDLDLHIEAPSEEYIFFGNRVTEHGELDVDMNVHEDDYTGRAVENIYFAQPEPGTYTVIVNTYSDRTEGPVPAIVRVKIGERYVTHQIQVEGRIEVVRFEYQPADPDEGDIEWLE